MSEYVGKWRCTLFHVGVSENGVDGNLMAQFHVDPMMINSWMLGIHHLGTHPYLVASKTMPARLPTFRICLYNIPKCSDYLISGMLAFKQKWWAFLNLAQSSTLQPLPSFAQVSFDKDGGFQQRCRHFRHFLPQEWAIQYMFQASWVQMVSIFQT